MSQQCSELSKYHKEVVLPIVVQIFKANLGIIPNSMIRDIVFESTGRHVSPCNIRAIIHEIRVKGLVNNIIANANGYRIARTVAEAAQYIDDLQSRAMAIHDVQGALKRQVEETFGHQTSIEYEKAN
jgi:hypothetical protein